tara:strand:+ start:165 stop:359 length:195 start_codon:yes stop_codon:yes gene_type:complete
MIYRPQGDSPFVKGMIKPSKEELIEELHKIAEDLGGTCHQYETLNSVHRSSSKIVIEYDVEQSK